MSSLLTVTEAGLFCERGGFFVDPWRPVDRALLTHAHADHARPGSATYLATEPSLAILRKRLGAETVLQGLPYGETLQIGETRVSFHPAGHVLGSAQIRVEADGEIWVVGGDYKRAADPTCAPFEVVKCHTFITEATFGLPVYRWESGSAVARDVLTWWDANRAAGRAAVLFCYALGKAQRLLGELAALTDRSVYTHGAVEGIVACYRAAGIRMLPTQPVADAAPRHPFAGELVLAPPSAFGTSWLRRFAPYETAFASGWMRLRGARRRKGYDRGFVLSDHADWPDLLRTAQDCGAERILATHGYSDVLARALRDRGLDAATLTTSFGETEGDDLP